MLSDGDALAEATSTFSAFLQDLARFSSIAPAFDSAPAPALGTTLAGRFELRRLIGQGGMGFVYEAFDRQLQMSVALKVLNGVRAEHRVLLKNEFRALESICHRNLVRPGQLMIDGEHWFFTMELVCGDEPIAWSRGRPERVRWLLLELADVLGAMHRAGVVHGDLKPSNIIVADDGRAVVLDLGLARSDTNPACFAFLGGTPAYMAPEQHAGQAGAAASDMYALGMVARDCLLGVPSVGTRGWSSSSALSDQDATISADLAELCEELVSADPSARPKAEEVRRRLSRHVDGSGENARVPSERGALIGRDAELRTLRTAFQRVLRGGSAAVFIEGSSGIGKTHLVSHFQNAVSARPDTLVLRGRCHKSESLPFKAVDGIVDCIAFELSRRKRELLPEIDRETLGTLSRTFPCLGAVRPAPFAKRRDLEGDGRQRLFEAFRRLLSDLSGQRKLVIFLDDVQWADEDGLALLRDALAAPFSGSVLIIGASREAAPSTFESLPAFAAVKLGALAPPHCELLARQLLPAVESDRRSLDALVHESRGHPLYLTELIHAHLEHQRPASNLDELILTRAARLTPKARELLQLVAVAGSRVPVDIVRATTALHGESFVKTLRHLETERFIAPCHIGMRDATDTAHDRIRESVLAALQPEARRGLHRMLAETLARVAPDDPAQLAVHWHAAGDEHRARVNCANAIDKAIQASAFGQAAELLALAAEISPPEQANALLERRSEALAAACQPLEAAELLLSLAERNPERRAAARLRAASHLFVGGAFDRALLLQRSILSDIGVDAPRGPRRALLTMLGLRVHMKLVHRFPGLARWFTRPFAEHEFDALHAAASALSTVDGVLALGYHCRAVVAAYRLNDAVRIARGLALEACIQANSGSFERTEALLAVGHRMTSAHRDGEAEMMLLGARCVLTFLHGKWEEALLHLEPPGGDRYRGLYRNAVHQTWKRLYGVQIRFNRGRIAAMQQHCDALVHAAAQRGDRMLDVALGVSFVPLVCLARDDEPSARQALSRARALSWSGSSGGYLSALGLVSELWIELYAQRFANARALTKRRPSEVAVARRYHYTRVYLTFLEANAALGVLKSRGPTLRLHSQLLRAARALENDPIPWAKPYGALLRAQLSHLGHSTDTGAHLERAAAAFEHFACDHMATIARAALTQRFCREVPRLASDYLHAEGVLEPARFLRTLAPGFW